ncbi:MAG: aspartate kinase [Gammaproteobacteria bacterium]
MTKPIVIKLGGSLMHSPHLQHWLNAISEHGKGRAVIVPGGSEFADKVRIAQQQTGFDDLGAHRLALFAMLQFGLQIISLQPRIQPAATREQINTILANNAIALWQPLALMNDQSDIPASWDYTSDSIALWLATQLNADLYLVKSVSLNKANFSMEALQQAGVVDAGFVELTAGFNHSIVWLGPNQFADFSRNSGNFEIETRPECHC